jgi:plastocyanin
MKSHSLRTLAVLAAVLILVACGGGGGEEAAAPAPEAAPEAAPSAGGSGSIAGTVTYNNGDPDTEIKMDADPVCAGLHDDAVHTETVAVSDAGQLANVFVYIKEGASGGAAPTEAHVLDQQGCLYQPHVSGIQVGQKLIIRNSDPTLHNVHAMPAVNAEFNQGQPFQGMELEKTFDQAEVMIPFKCDVHPWMSSYMAVLDHGYFAVSGADGGFSIGDLPAGDYVVEAWHEALGTQSESITVGDGEAVELNFDFQPAT